MISDDGSTDTDKPTLRLWIIVIIARSEVMVLLLVHKRVSGAERMSIKYQD